MINIGPVAGTIQLTGHMLETAYYIDIAIASSFTNKDGHSCRLMLAIVIVVCVCVCLCANNHPSPLACDVCATNVWMTRFKYENFFIII